MENAEEVSGVTGRLRLICKRCGGHTFLTLSQTFEDLGVAACKGQAATLMGNGDILTTALQIHSVEARHAAMVRRIGGKPSWDTAFDEPMTKDAVPAAATLFLVA